MGDLTTLQHRILDQAAEYEWIDEISRSMERVGQDPSGAVHTALDRRNFPTKFVVARDWQARLGERRLDAAIMEAVGIAFADGWRKATEEVKNAVQRGERRRVPATTSEIGTAALPGRDVGDLIEDILSMTSAAAVPAGSTDSGVASGHDAFVWFEFSDYGLSACGIDQSWALRHPASQITTNINNRLIADRDRFAAESRTKPRTSDLLAATEQLVGLLQDKNRMRGR
ncbi:hypothetical protein [Nocardia bovistercoris]|uniref:Uncharacterized protein n=1 Tax=Nocardia bovistercoris TaxID=2785916 RepID=A0A931I8S8_9NOCA|nr:hypothetical protein [Nocardia bovistercoris]MBH0776784.1 hypothetical protein [Nocardia bovistercoris]